MADPEAQAAADEARKGTDRAKILQEELRAAQQRLATGDQRAAGDISALQSEIARDSGAKVKGSTSTGGKVQASVPASDGKLKASTTSTRSSSSVSGLDLNPLEIQGNQQQAVANQGMLLAMLKGAMDVRAGYNTEIGQQVTKHGEAQGKIAQADGNVEIAKNLNSRSIMEAVNGGHDPDSVLVQSEIQITAARQKKDALREQIDRAESGVTIFTDPLQWLVNAATLPTLKKQFNAEHYKEADLMRRQQDTQEKFRRQLAIDTPNMVKDVQIRVNAMAESAAAEAAVKAAVAAASTQQDTISLISTTMAAERWNYETGLQTTKLLADRYQINAADVAGTKADKELQETVLNPLNIRRMSVGLQPYTISQFKFLSGAKRSELMDMAMSPNWGKDPGEAIKNFISEGALNTVQQARPEVARFLRQQIGQPEVEVYIEEQKVRNPKFAMLSPLEQQQQALSAVTEKQTKDTAAANKTRDHTKLADDHFYKLKFYEIKDIPEIQNTIAGKFIKEKYALDSITVPKDKELWAHAFAQVKLDPSKMPQIAKEMSDFYRQGQMAQWTRTGQAELGYPRPNGYVLRVLTKQKAMETWSQSDVERWFTIMLTEESNETEGRKHPFNLPPATRDAPTLGNR